MSRLLVPVFVAGWQQGCCGDTFALGDQVGWRLRLEPDAEWDQVVLPVDVEPLPRRARKAWAALGNDPGPSPVLAHHHGLTVFVPDATRLEGRTLRGGLLEDRHVGIPDGVPPTTATVARIRLVTRTFRVGRERELVAMPGPADLDDLADVTRELPEVAAASDPLLVRQATGLLVDLQLDRARATRV